MNLQTRYARALLEAAEEQQKFDQVKDDFAALMDELKKYPEVSEIIKNPAVKIDEKKDIIDTLLENKEPLLNNLVMLAIDKKREKLLWSIYHSFELLAAEKKQEVICEITTAFPLGKEEEEEIRKFLSRQVDNKKVILRTKVDKTVVGGIVVKIGDKVYDYSIHTQLDKMRDDLKKISIERMR